MDKVAVILQVFFEEPFWIGICERVEDNQLSACKIMFGAEPKDYELEEYVLVNWNRLSFSPATEAITKQMDHMNPKRQQREVKKQMTHIGIGTKSQQALQLQHEENKLIRMTRSRQMKEAEEERLYAIKEQKRKEKHKGR
jgi:hypothetical protein